MKQSYAFAQPWTASETRSCSLQSSVIAEMCLPTSWTSSMTCRLYEPAVMTATRKQGCTIFKLMMLHSLVIWHLLGCCSLFSCCRAQTELKERIIICLTFSQLCDPSLILTQLYMSTVRSSVKMFHTTATNSISANVTKMKVDEISYRILANAFNLI